MKKYLIATLFCISISGCKAVLYPDEQFLLIGDKYIHVSQYGDTTEIPKKWIKDE